ncbi:MAG TPA: beta-1,6-N-acetylglucosaminyltransferase [Candidatus Limnocylindria bacterium]|nr:beta-1,6-N-acetylglucosaminyltransferase [Candidatus Limnocylindria bacterium]
MTEHARPTVVYFIASHTNPDQVARLVRRLRRDSPNALVLIHHDESQSHLGAERFAGDANVVVMPESVAVEWGQFSQVELVLRGIDALLATGRDFDWVVLLSGQDYPIRPIAEFETDLARLGDGAIAYEEQTALLDRYVLSWHRLPRWLENRITNALFSRLSRFNARQPFVRFVSGRVGCQIGVRTARSPFGATLRPYKGTTWWTLSRRCIDYVRTYVRDNPSFVDWYRRRTLMPDESFFQTILFNAGIFRLRNDDGRFVRWEPPEAPSPVTLRAVDLDAVLASGKYFGRKFDERVDAAVLDRLDAHLG